MHPADAGLSRTAAEVAPRLLAWFGQHGRRNLPWQQDPTPYRVWVSEIMLQQTQVATVIPYYERFIARFPNVEVLAAAPLDEVLHLWTGLGYYARARNLHRAAQIVVERQGGLIPDAIDVLQTLPGIGRSTAGAILALARSQRHPILDGNARRVLARYFGVEGHAGEPQTLRRLWALADACTPQESVAQYTQAIMDLGSSLCLRTRPACQACPLGDGCAARATDRQAQLPSPRPKRSRPHRAACALIACHKSGAVLLQKRPADGLWGGLWSFPMFDTRDDALWWLHKNRCSSSAEPQPLPPYEHAFTHFDLRLHPVVASIDGGKLPPLPAGHRWYDLSHPARIGLTKPVTELLRRMRV